MPCVYKLCHHNYLSNCSIKIWNWSLILFHLAECMWAILIKTTSMYRVKLFFFLILLSNVKTKEPIFIPDEITYFTRDRGRERVIRHCEGEIEDHHHVRPSPTFNPASCHWYILPKPLLIQVSLNNKNWYQIWFRFCYFGLIFINLGIWVIGFD